MNIAVVGLGLIGGSVCKDSVMAEEKKLPLETLCEFVKADGFADMLFSHAAEFPESVKPYEDGYPILAVEKNK